MESGSEGARRPLRIVVSGATGRMGARVLAACAESRDVECVAALASPRRSGEVAGVPLVAALDGPVDALIDFSTPAGCARAVEQAVRAGAALVIGTTSYGDEVARAIESAARSIPIVVAPNTSIGANVLLRVTRDVARALAASAERFDVEIVDVHHREKRDAPSGTARALRDALAPLVAPPSDAPAPSSVPGPPIHSLRIGGRVGDHTVLFASHSESLSLSHSAHDRRVFAEGALAAARWVATRAPGIYGMHDVLFGDA